jgi:hypothetical protein
LTATTLHRTRRTAAAAPPVKKPARKAPVQPPRPVRSAAPRQRRGAALILNPRLAALTPEAWQCKNLRHAWPRGREGTELIELEHRGGRLVLADIVMTCDGGCGVSRTIRVEPTGTGGMRRVGKPRYTYPPEGYLFAKPKRLPDGTREVPEPVTPEEITFAAITARWPGVKW